ncbi:hypothetical protein ACQZM9_13580 [Streptomyces sp. P11-1]|uniref:hypothetical protein n=1 Tax=Streptomyces sp. P11-1 TaxID=3423221 RepID=UPI003D2EE546
MTAEPQPGHPAGPAPADEELFRDALCRTADDLPPLPDLVPDAVREGQRRRARRRGFAVAGAFTAVTCVTLGIALLGPLLRHAPDAEPAAPPSGPSITRPVPEPSATSAPSATPAPSFTRPAPDTSPDPTEPVTGMTPPTPSTSFPPSSSPPPGPGRPGDGPHTAIPGSGAAS